MRNIWTIFTRDIRKIRTNVIALIVVLGVTVVPCLYAWYNIAASWDPYGNTGNLKVAVASVDEGYIGNLIPLQLNLGDQVLSALRENTQLNWVFTTKSKAMKGVKSGEYYAAIVIPEDFSTNLISVFSSDIKKPEITYYSNAKENAIAPKVTDKGATAVQTQVNEVFIETISDTVLTALQTVANTADSRDSDELAGTLITNLNKIGSDLSASSTTLHSFSQMTDSAQQLLDTTAGFLKVTKEQASANADTLSGTQQSFSGIQETLDGATDGINTALTSTKSFYEQMSQTIDQAFQSQSQDASSVASTLDLLSDRVNTIVQSYQGIRDSIAQIADAHPELSDLTAPIPALDVVGDKFEKGKIFLPQLIMAADVAKVCFDEVKNYMSAKGGQSEQKGKIVIATVKGDIHDIGKNIVKVILENYGYNVIDLGRDVDPMKVVEAVKENDVKLVGLSALMTTTLGSMEDTINLLKENNLDCKIMVGGAVLTEDYAMKIGADYYAKDAKRSADIAKEVLG